MDAKQHFARGLTHYDSKRFDDALADFARAIELSPDYAEPYTGRGYVYSLFGDFRAAMVDFNKAIELNPSDADAWKGRADARQIIGEFLEAIVDYSEAILLNPQYAHCFHRRGDARTAIGAIDEAISDYRQAILLDCSNPVSHYFLAGLLAQTECYSAAVDHYRKAIEIDPNLDAFVYSSYAWILATCPDAEVRDPAEAIRMAKVAYEVAEEEQECGVLAAAYAANGNFTEAVKWQTKACEAAEDERKELQRTRLRLYKSGKSYVGADGP